MQRVLSFFARLLAWFLRGWQMQRQSTTVPSPRMPPCTTCGTYDSQGTGMVQDSTLGIAVCHGCGGLGVVPFGPSFSASVDEIVRQRDVLRANEPGYPPLPIILLVQRSEVILGAVAEHYRRFGHGVSACFAEQVATGVFEPQLKFIREQAAQMLELARRPATTPGPIGTACRMAWVAAHSGEIEAAEAVFKLSTASFPESSQLAHDYAAFLIHFLRDRAAAMPWLEAAAHGLPADAVFPHAAALNAAMLGRAEDIGFYLETAASFEDLRGLPPDARAWIAQHKGIVERRQKH